MFDSTQFLKSVNEEAPELLEVATKILDFAVVFDEAEVTYDDDGVACLYVGFSLPYPDDGAVDRLWIIDNLLDRGDAIPGAQHPREPEVFLTEKSPRGLFARPAKPDESWRAAVYGDRAEVLHLEADMSGVKDIAAQEQMPLDEFVEVLSRLWEQLLGGRA